MDQDDICLLDEWRDDRPRGLRQPLVQAVVRVAMFGCAERLAGGAAGLYWDRCSLVLTSAFGFTPEPQAEPGMHGADMARKHSLTDSARPGELAELAERLGAAMDAGMVVLYGSRATGTQRHDSDVDIAIIDARRADSENGCRVLAGAGADEPPIDSGHLASRDFTDCFASTRGLHRSVWNDGLILYSPERGIESPPPRLRRVLARLNTHVEARGIRLTHRRRTSNLRWRNPPRLHRRCPRSHDRTLCGRTTAPRRDGRFAAPNDTAREAAAGR